MDVQVNERGFLVCPLCGKKTNTKVLPKTTLIDFPLYCNRCKKAVVISHIPKARA